MQATAGDMQYSKNSDLQVILQETAGDSRRPFAAKKLGIGWNPKGLLSRILIELSDLQLPFMASTIYGKLKLRQCEAF